MLYQAADLHLTPTVWKDMPSMQGDSYAALDQIVRVCASAGKQTSLLICGDIFDKPKPDSESVDRFVKAMHTLRQAAVDVYVIQGQHEKAEPPWATALGASVFYVGTGEPFVINVGNGKSYDKVSVVGFDYSAPTDLKDRLKAIKQVDIVLVHQMAKQAMDIEGAWNFDVGWVNKKVKLILAGDYHEKLNVGRLWYPGATHMRKIDEVGNKYFLQINTGAVKGKKFTVTPQQLWTRPVIEVRVLTDEQLDAAVKMIMDAKLEDDRRPKEISQELVIARYSPGVKDVVARIEEACQKREFLLRLKPLVSDVQEEQTELPQAAATLNACLDALVDRGQDEELHAFVSELLNAPDPRAVLGATKQRLGIGG
jgi:DNA repair exonuclease SbcCD nuclease subunit